MASSSSSSVSINSNSTSSANKYPYPWKLEVSEFVRSNLSAIANNYDQWKQEMLGLINEKSLFDFITKEAPSKTVTIEEQKVENQDYIFWKRSDALLQQWIQATLTAEIYYDVRRFKTARGWWKRLENLFSSKLLEPNITATAMASSYVTTLSVSEKNYSEWRKQMYEFIKSQGIVGHIDGTGKPRGVLFWSWKRRDAQVRELIRTKLHEDILQKMADIIPDRVDRTAKAMWVALDIIFGHYVGLYKATINGDCEKAEEFIKQEPDNIAMRAAISDSAETVLIVAVKSRHRNNFVTKLVNRMSPEDLAQGDWDERTALHRAAAVGNLEAAKLLVEKNRYLPNAQTAQNRIPLYFAATHRNKEMVTYLLSVTEDEAKANHSSPSYQKPDRWNSKPFEGESGFRILHQLILSEFYDIALDLVRRKPELAFFIPKKEHLEYLSLIAISQKPSSFRSGFSSFNFFKQLIYSLVPVNLENNGEHHYGRDVESAGSFTSVADANVKKRLHAMLWKITEIFLPCIKDIWGKKLVHEQAVELVKFLCDQIANANYSTARKIFSLSLEQATSAGIYEIVQEILKSYPDAISLQNGKNQSIFHQAIVWRHEQVFNLVRQIGKSRTIFLGQCDVSQNNALHLAGFLAPQEQLYRRAGAALQMQRELQWFKEVENRALTQHKEKKNKEGKTPAQIFTETHKDLIKDGEQWLKDTANASTIVAALIATMVFAAAITVPGGNNGDGYPVFYKRASFLIFGISDAFALFSSMTSVLLFLSILTSRYGENDFLVIIPRRLIFGLITLFLSILSTMIAFGATLYLVFGDSYKTWIIFPMLVLPGIPAILFVFLQFPLLVDMYKSTYRTIFVKQDADMLY